MRQILKCSYYKNYCIDHNQVLQNDSDHQVLTVGGPNMPKEIKKVILLSITLTLRRRDGG